MTRFELFFLAISNEISIENDILRRIHQSDLNFLPVRSLRTYGLIKQYKIKRKIYIMICILYTLNVFLLNLFNFGKKLTRRKTNQNKIIGNKLVLVSNGRIINLFKKLKINEGVTYININQNFGFNSESVDISAFLSFKDYVIAYINACIGVFIVLFRLKDKTDILQTYVSYEWFLTYIALKKIDKIENIYFANHYDRWAVLFDEMFKNSKITLLQHGVLPEGFELAYKLRNIDTIYTMDNESVEKFKKLYECDKTKFLSLSPTIELNEIENIYPSILIIGQPHSIDKEIDIVKALQKLKKCIIYIKPHPLYSDKKYTSLENIILIKDKDFFPRVNLALSYESTLGIEYECSNIEVLWWKDKNTKTVVDYIKNRLKL